MNLYHYYDRKVGAFVSLSGIALDDANAILSAIKKNKPTTQSAMRQPEYMKRRHEIEEILMTAFRKKGGVIRRKKPHYMVVEPCEWLSTWFENSSFIKIPITEFDTNTISFTYGDAFPVFSETSHKMDDKEYRRKLYTYEEILELKVKYGLPQNWNANGDHGPERYIEAHIWCDDVISKYREDCQNENKFSN